MGYEFIHSFIFFMSSSTRQARVCLLGGGRMGQLRAPILYANPRLALACVADVSAAAGTALAAKYPGTEFRDATDLEAALRGARCDALWVSTPTFTHGGAVRAAVAAGVKFVFMEKPVDEGPEGVKALFALCRAEGVQLCCGFQRRFDPSYRAVQEAVKGGRVGKPEMVRVMFADHPAPPMDFLLKGGAR